MEHLETNTKIFTIDEYGRININDEKIFELISGSGDLLTIQNGERCNKGCGSNLICANFRC